MSTITEVTKQKRLRKEEELKQDLIHSSKTIQMQIILKSSEINYDQPIGQIIRQAREMQGLTCKELSKLSNISKDQIDNIESGRTKQPQLNTIRRLFQALKLDREKLISKGKEINYDLPFGQLIKQAREIQGITCRELSELIDASENQIHNIESGRTKQPRLDTIRRLIQALKLDREKVISKGNEINYDLPLGQIIKQAREMQALTLKELSEISEISISQIYSIESSTTKRPNSYTIIKLTQALNLELDLVLYVLNTKC